MFQLLRNSVKRRALSSRIGSLILLFQRSPLVQILFPEARILGGAGLGKMTQWTIATVAGLGAYDSVAGATAIAQLAPNAGLATVSATSGSRLSFIFQCTGTPGIPKSWSITGALPTGLSHANATNNTVDSISGVPTQTGSFKVTVIAWRNAGQSGDSFSKSFTLRVSAGAVTAPGITSQPASVTINSGGTATFNATASGTSPSFQWYSGNSGDTTYPVGGANSPSYTTQGLYENTAYWVRASNSAGGANSNTATVTVITPPSIGSQPQPATIIRGNTATFIVAASGTSPAFQWYAGNSGVTTNPIAGATGFSFTTPVLTATASYWVRTTNAAGIADSVTVIANVIFPPVITTQPISTTIDSGGSATLAATASGDFLNFQWYVGISGDTTNPILGAIAEAFYTPPLAVSTRYWVRVTSVAGTADSDLATVTVNDPLTTWKNDQFSAQDLADPLVSGPTADPDGDGINNTAEYILGSLPLVPGLSPSPIIETVGTQTLLNFTTRAASGPGYNGLTRHYAIERSDSLGPTAWLPVDGYSDMVGNGQLINYQTPLAGPRHFYRLNVWLKP